MLQLQKGFSFVALQSEYLSLNSTLNDIEGHIHKPEPNKGGQQYNLPDDLDSKLFTDIKDMTLQEKVCHS